MLTTTRRIHRLRQSHDRRTITLEGGARTGPWFRMTIGLAVLTMLTVLIAACGDGQDTSRASRSGTPAPPGPHKVVRFCTGHGAGWRPLGASVNGQPVDAAALGAGTAAVVLVNESDNDECVG